MPEMLPVADLLDKTHTILVGWCTALPGNPHPSEHSLSGPGLPTGRLRTSNMKNGGFDGQCLLSA